MKGRKGSTDDGGVRSPLFIRWPGKIEPGKNIASISAAIDLLPTLTDLAGIDPLVKKPLDGMSLKPLLLESQPAWPDRMIFNHWDGKVSVRTQQYRLDQSRKLFDMQRDQGQRQNIANQMLPVAEKLSAEVQRWREEVLSELPTSDTRSFPLGHPDTRYTQLPARDGQPHGNIKRSNRFPNASFFTNWIHVEDKISWNIEVVESGDFEVVLYYTCPQKDAGSTVELSFGESRLKGHIAEGFDPPLRGMENDRVERTESYVKDFKALNLGVVHLEKGEGQLTLQALRIPGSTVMDFRLLMFERVE